MNRSIVATIIAVDMMLALPTTSHAKTGVSVGIGNTLETGVPDGTLEVGLHIELIGPGATDALATQWATWIENFWQEMAEENSCMNLNITADVTAGNNDWLPVLSPILQPLEPFDLLTLNLLEGASEGNDALYVVDTAPGQTYRAWVQAGGINQSGSYGGDVVGMLPAEAPEGMVLHEAGHLLGMPDHYTDGVGPDPGWERNVMAETLYAGTLIRTLTGHVPTDGRNFQEMMNAIEELADVDVRPCMRLEALVDTAFNNPPTNIDRLTGEMKFEIRAAHPLVPELVSPLEPPRARITGDGEGEYAFSVEVRSDSTLFGGFMVDNNPWPIEVSGFIEDETIYQTQVVALDKMHQFLKDGSSYGGDAGVIQMLMSNNATVCTVDNLMLALLRLDIDLVEVGMTCEFPINQGFWDNGQFTVTVVSVQGNGAPVR